MSVSRGLVVAAVVGLIAALSTSDPHADRPKPEWYVQVCAEVSSC
jgi:hypothetical protein